MTTPHLYFRLLLGLCFPRQKKKKKNPVLYDERNVRVEQRLPARKVRLTCHIRIPVIEFTFAHPRKGRNQSLLHSCKLIAEQTGLF